MNPPTSLPRQFNGPVSFPLRCPRRHGPPALAEGARQFASTTTSGTLRSVWRAASARQRRGEVEVRHHGMSPDAGGS